MASSSAAGGSFEMQYMITVRRSDVESCRNRAITDAEWETFKEVMKNDLQAAEDDAFANALEAIIPPETDTEDSSSAPATDAASAADQGEWQTVYQKRMRLPVYATADGSTIIARGTYFQVYGGGPEGGYLKPYPKSYVGLPYTMHPDSIWRIQRTWAQRYHVVETLRGVLHQTSEGGCLLVRFVPSATP